MINNRTNRYYEHKNNLQRLFYRLHKIWAPEKQAALTIRAQLFCPASLMRYVTLENRKLPQ